MCIIIHGSFNIILISTLQRYSACINNACMLTENQHQVNLKTELVNSPVKLLGSY